MAALTRKQEAELRVVLAALRDAHSNLTNGAPIAAREDIASAMTDLGIFIALNGLS
ncbi:hypothetical protein E3_1275 [Rhodococcus phage E3]|uniref:hypothetical protein n=1 Tax=Rhodococcus phage E3 TaxID=1007869 RepID=UPI0002C6DD88|nr:hypothetical protein M176_gp134 [Rhodococcus phage E3]AEQ21042.1 hypothetical protein E3_1275 [Rhodococcus phage E3]